MTTILLMMQFVLPTLGLLQPPTGPGGATAIQATGAFLALSVADLQASAKWYSEKLGLKVVMDGSKQKQNKAAAMVLEGGGLIVELVQHDDAAPLAVAAPSRKDPILVHGLFKAGAIVADFDGTLALLKQRGVKIAYGPFPAKPNQRAYVIIEDNAGNLIQFFGQ
jgi:catechol 2,3-dioxygenase-like lactoylglutathione lyase family enzyme